MYTSSGSKATEAAKDTMVNEGGSTGNDKDKGRSFQDQARETAKSAEDTMEGAACRAGKNARDMLDTAEHRVEDMGISLASKIRHQPFTAVATAAAAGLLFGLLYHRR